MKINVATCFYNGETNCIEFLFLRKNKVKDLKTLEFLQNKYRELEIKIEAEKMVLSLNKNVKIEDLIDFPKIVLIYEDGYTVDLELSSPIECMRVKPNYSDWTSIQKSNIKFVDDYLKKLGINYSFYERSTNYTQVLKKDYLFFLEIENLAEEYHSAKIQKIFQEDDELKEFFPKCEKGIYSVEIYSKNIQSRYLDKVVELAKFVVLLKKLQIQADFMYENNEVAISTEIDSKKFNFKTSFGNVINDFINFNQYLQCLKKL